MKEHVERLLGQCPGAMPEYFEASDWFDDGNRDAVETTIAEFTKAYERRLKDMIELLGRPDQTEETGRAAIDRWYPEAIRASCWFRDGKTLCLALEQQDQETPVAVLLRCLSADEIEALTT